MKGYMRLEKPDDQPVSMTITMPMCAWRLLKEQIALSEKKGSYPLWQFQELVNDLVSRCEKVVFSEEQPK